MPKYQSGMAIWQVLTAQEIFKFHEQQYFNTFNKKQATKKGKLPVKCQEEQEALGLAPSPSITLAPLCALSLESSPSIPDPSPESLASLTFSNTHSFPELPPIAHLWQTSPASNSGASDGKNLTARVSAIESSLEKLRRDVDWLLKAIGL